MQRNNTDLNAIVEILQAENAALSERAEDTLLYGLVAETIYQTDDSTRLIDQILERISILKNIPFCACLELTEEGSFEIIDSYLSFADLPHSEIRISFPEIESRIPLDEGYLLLNKTEFDSFGFSVNIRGKVFMPFSALIIPCQSKSIPNLFFVFVDDDTSADRFPHIQALLQQVLKLAAERLENIFMFGELMSLNSELDQRVKERTKELTRINKKLNREIQERKIIEKALSAEEKKLRLVYNAATDVSFVTVDLSSDFKIRSYSPGAEKMFGYSVEEVAGKSLKSFQLSGDFNIFSAIRRNFKKLGWSRMDEIVLRRKSGDFFTAMLTVYPLIDENSEQTGLLVVCFDISKLKDTQNQLIAARETAEENETKFRTLFEQASDGIFITDNSGNYLDVNESGCHMLGFSKEELLKLNMKDIIGAENLKESPMKIEELRTGNVVRAERILVRKDGSSFPVEISAKMFPDGRMQGIVRDITDRRKFEKELVAAKEKAEESDRLKTAFLQNMSHEIRTPLNAILGFADLLPEFFDEKQKLVRFASIIKQRGNDLLAIIADILDIAQIESGQMELHLNVCHLGQFFDDMEIHFQEYQNRLSPDNVAFNLQVGRLVKSLVVTIDQGRLKQILFSLLSNAFKFTHSGKIELGCSLTKEDELTFYVSDTGIGIPKEKHAEIFNRFTQVGNDAAQLYGGTGLGLSIVMGLVNLMGGRIWLESEKGEGSTFYFTLPFKGEYQQVPDSTDVSVKEEGNHKVNVLIVENDEFDAMFLKEIFWGTEFAIFHANSGKQALDLCTMQTIDLVVMDIHIPDVDACKLNAQIRKHNPQVGIIALSSNASAKGEQKALAAGFDDYLSYLDAQKVLLSRIDLLLHANKAERLA
jgi:PAS domain S-box-containing protein